MVNSLLAQHCGMSSNNKHRENGYIAIVSAVILTIVILTIAISFSSSNFLGRFDSGFFESKEATSAYAQGCIEYTLLKLSIDSGYAGNESVAIASSTCTIRPITTGGGQKIIQTYAIVDNKTTNLEITVDENTLETILFREVSSF